jgi:hypothetical protein
MKKPFLIVICISIVFGWLSRAIEPIEPAGLREWDMVPAEKAAKLDLSRARIQGTFKDPQRKAILELVGRVKGINPTIQNVDLSRDEFTAAARVTTENKVVYLTINVSIRWEIVKVIRILY